MSKSDLDKKIKYEYEDDDVSEYVLVFKFDIFSRLLALVFNACKGKLKRKNLELPDDPEKQGYTDIDILPNYYGVILTSLLKSIKEVEIATDRQLYTRNVERARFYLEGKKWHVEAKIKGTFIQNLKNY